MNTYLITGSIGHISKPIIEGLVKAGKDVRVITSSQDRASKIESISAKAIVGNLQDVVFLKEAFKNVDVVYTMIPPIWKTNNWNESQTQVGRNYVEAITANKVKYVVNLSSIGAHRTTNGMGPVDGLRDIEQLLNKISGLNVRHLRPSFYLYNFLNQIWLAKEHGVLGGNYGRSEDSIFLVHTKDIAKAALEELLNLDFVGSSFRYVISDERTGNEIAEILGKSVNKNLSWVVFSDIELKERLLQRGLSESLANGFMEMGRAIREGTMQEDARRNMPPLGQSKLEDFAKEFAQSIL